MKKILTLVFSHTLIAFAGFALGIYMLPILTAPDAPSTEQMAAAAENIAHKGEFRRDLKGSDFFHWGEGEVLIGSKTISLQGQIAPGPDYKLYLSPVFVETEAEFVRHKAKMVRVGDVKTFDNFIVQVPDSIDPANYNSVIIWCEAFGEFITAASYR